MTNSLIIPSLSVYPPFPSLSLHLLSSCLSLSNSFGQGFEFRISLSTPSPSWLFANSQSTSWPCYAVPLLLHRQWTGNFLVSAPLFLRRHRRCCSSRWLQLLQRLYLRVSISVSKSISWVFAFKSFDAAGSTVSRLSCSINHWRPATVSLSLIESMQRNERKWWVLFFSMWKFHLQENCIEIILFLIRLSIKEPERALENPKFQID